MLMERFDLIPHQKKMFRELSGGLKRRVVLARALVNDPKLLILDEPTAGVDVELRRVLWRYLQEINRDGKTILLTSHYLEEVERLCDRVVIIDHGRVLADDTLAGLLASAPVANTLTLKYDPSPDGAALEEIKNLPGVIRVDLAGPELSVAATDLGTAAPRVLERLAARGFSCQELTSRRANLEDVFLALTGRTLRDT